MLRLTIALTLIACARYCLASSVIIGGFAYYKDRSPESVVEEITANGFDDVRIVGCTAGQINGALVSAFAKAGVPAWLLTFASGSYGTQGLPEGWENFKMQLRGRENETTGFIFFCPNNPDYREWKKKDIAESLSKHKFHGIDLAEPQMPGGPEAAVYGCLCGHCAAAFKKMFPDAAGIPDFADSDSPLFYKSDKTLYEKWVAFRTASVVSFLDDLVNGKGGIREKCPDVKVATWSLALDTPDQLAKLREWYGLDGAAIVRRVKPDCHVIQTDWPDWIKANLPPDYVLKYKPVFDSVREAAPRLQLILQSDIGSQAQMRRSREWMQKLEETAKKMGFAYVTSYEYFLGDFIYTEPPAPVRAVFEQPDTIKIVFNKRLDPGTAASIGSYSLDSGKVDFARVDGNIVRLTVSGAGNSPTVTISGLSDDESRRLFHDKPACVMPQPERIMVEPLTSPDE